MPILDPSLVLTLLENRDTLEHKSKSFIFKILQEASKNVSRNLDTIESLVQFRKDFKAGYNDVLEFFQAKVTKKEIDDPNIYKLLYSTINTDIKAQESKFGFTGSYYLYDSSLKFFQPCLTNDLRSWYLTSTKVAILCIHTLKKTDNFVSESIKLFCIEVDLMISCGYSVAICVNYDSISKEFNDQLIDLFKTHHFIEIHLIIDFKKIKKKKAKKQLVNAFPFSNEMSMCFYLY